MVLILVLSVIIAVGCNLRNEDLGNLWEHFVLNELDAHLQTSKIHYWRDKRGTKLILFC